LGWLEFCAFGQLQEINLGGLGWELHEEGVALAKWVRLCSVAESPDEGKVQETGVGDVQICLARVNGELAALDNLCPHRQGPLGQGWVEGEAVICPWHSWAFNVKTGVAEYPVHERIRVKVFPLKVEGGDVLVQIEEARVAESV
jgi:nitrite reductase (NADH) small subunit